MGLKERFTPSPEVQVRIQDGLGARRIASGEYHGDFWIEIAGEHLVGTVDFLRTDPDLRFDSFVDLCGVDYLGRIPRFEVVIHLSSQSKQHRIRIRCLVSDDTLTVPSLTRFWKGANWQEREAYDMYGIRFDGHPHLSRILSPPGETIHPQRKDYPLKGSRGESE